MSEGYLHPGRRGEGGPPSSQLEGGGICYPHLVNGGYPHLANGGRLYLADREGYPHPADRGYPHQGWMGVSPTPHWDGMGIPLRSGKDGCNSPSPRAEQQSEHSRRAVCLLRSRRTIFLFNDASLATGQWWLL